MGDQAQAEIESLREQLAAALSVAAEVARIKAVNADLEARNALLELQNEKMRRTLYGQRSERTRHLLDQMELSFEEWEATASEDEGLAAISVAEAAPGLVCGEGALGRVTPDDDHKSDIAAALRIVHALGALDVGQGAVVCDGLALAVEAAEGTDAMLERIPALRESLRGTASKPRGVLVKALKPTQDAKTDMPVVGVQTVRGAAAAFLAGIALEAGKSLVLDRDAVRAEADRLGLFVVGVQP